jgi:ribosome biogenesis GTPase
MSLLDDYGYREPFVSAFAGVASGDRVPARVVAQQGDVYKVVCASGERTAKLSGKLRRLAASAADLPTVGDFVVLNGPAVSADSGDSADSADSANRAAIPVEARIEAVLPRVSRFSRRAPGSANVEQILVANVDVVFLVMGLDGDFNLRRLERYLTLAWTSGARPVVVLTKSDLCTQIEARRAEVEARAPDVPVIVTCLIQPEGEAPVRALLPPGTTGALLGSSGAGKSTLTNRLLASDVQRVRTVRATDDRGRHTTSHRQLFQLVHGALLIDTPGLREVQLWDAEAGLDAAFADVLAVARGCRFGDCAHAGEPGCAGAAALADGSLAEKRVAGYRHLQHEASAVTAKADPRVAQRHKSRDRAASKLLRARLKQKRR